MSKIKVNEIEAQSGSTITIPTGQNLVVTDGLATSSLPTIPVTKGGTGLTSLGTANQVLAVNSGATALEFQNAASGTVKQIKMFNRELTGDVSVGTGATWNDTGMVLTITGTNASNYYIHTFHLNEPWGNVSSWHLNFRVYNVTDGAVVGNQPYVSSIEGGGSHAQGVAVSGMIFEQASTSAKQYKIQYQNAGSNTAYVNWRGSDGYQSYSIQEVEGTLTTDNS